MAHGRIKLTRRNTRPAVMGYEQEYALYLRRWRRATQVRPSQYVITDLVDSDIDSILDGLTKNSYPEAVASEETGFFTRNGRLYVDDEFLEHSTTECMNPFELGWHVTNFRKNFVRFIQTDGKDLVSYYGSSSVSCTIGVHENIYTSLTNDDREDPYVCKTFQDFVNTRIVLFGSGGPEPIVDTCRHESYDPSEIAELEITIDTECVHRYCLSPRLAHRQLWQGEDQGYFENATIYMKDLTDADGMSRGHMAKADGLMSSDAIAHLVGVSAVVVRLIELKRMPLSDITWPERSKILNNHMPGRVDETFRAAVHYQREIFKAGKAYIDECREKGLYALFGDYEATEYFFSMWDTKLQMLEQYCRDQDVSALRHHFEWAARAFVVWGVAEKTGEGGFLDMSEKQMMASAEVSSMAPMSQKITKWQESFMDSDDSYRDLYLVPRAATRAQFLANGIENKVANRQTIDCAGWTRISRYVEGRDRSYEEVPLDTPFMGAAPAVKYEGTFYGANGIVVRGPRATLKEVEIQPTFVPVAQHAATMTNGLR